jgi:hypothetical protein
MWNEPSEEGLSQIPKLYETEDIPIKDKLIYLHFFIGGCDWYVVEYENDRFFGYVILNEDIINAEWGYFCLSELKEIKISGWVEIDCETEDIWKVKKVSEIKKIKV